LLTNPAAPKTGFPLRLNPAEAERGMSALLPVKDSCLNLKLRDGSCRNKKPRFTLREAGLLSLNPVPYFQHLINNEQNKKYLTHSFMLDNTALQGWKDD
jgi:hypothetical protein